MKAKTKTFGLFRHFRHACLMVRRNRRAYIKLSVTVVLSFTMLLAYMAVSDASLYNQYAKVFSLPRQVVQCYTYDETECRTFLNQIERDIPDAKYYSYFSASTYLSSYDASIHAECFFLPDGVQTLYSIDSNSGLDANSTVGVACVEPIELLGEKQDFYLQANETIINESFYNSLVTGGAREPIYIPLTFYWKDGSYSVWELKVVGICADSGKFISLNKESQKPGGYATVYLSQSQLAQADMGEFENVKHIAFVASDTPEQVMGLGRTLGMVAQGVAEAQNEARTALRASIRSKAVTAAVMLILLAINLYSSFSNVLETRNFEIGVKRAVGASKWSIVRQFLYEALLVLGFDAMLSAVLVADGLVFYKLVQKAIKSTLWVAYISPYSIAIYGFSSIGLTIAFSLLFAYKATRVEVVQYLKSE